MRQLPKRCLICFDLSFLVRSCVLNELHFVRKQVRNKTKHVQKQSSFVSPSPRWWSCPPWCPVWTGSAPRHLLLRLLLTWHPSALLLSAHKITHVLVRLVHGPLRAELVAPSVSGLSPCSCRFNTDLSSRGWGRPCWSACAARGTETSSWLAPAADWGPLPQRLSGLLGGQTGGNKRRHESEQSGKMGNGAMNKEKAPATNLLSKVLLHLLKFSVFLIAAPLRVSFNGELWNTTNRQFEAEDGNSWPLSVETSPSSTSMQRKQDVFDETKDSVVLDVARLTESLLQLLFHVFFGVEKINLWLLEIQ